MFVAEMELEALDVVVMPMDVVQEAVTVSEALDVVVMPMGLGLLKVKAIKVKVVRVLLTVVMVQEAVTVSEALDVAVMPMDVVVTIIEEVEDVQISGMISCFN
jgi:ribosomal protein L16/L10AE